MYAPGWGLLSLMFKAVDLSRPNPGCRIQARCTLASAGDDLCCGCTRLAGFRIQPRNLCRCLAKHPKTLREAARVDGAKRLAGILAVAVVPLLCAGPCLLTCVLNGHFLPSSLCHLPIADARRTSEPDADAGVEHLRKRFRFCK